MRKIATLLLLFLYTTSITGFGVKTFYCCNKLRSVSATFLLDARSEYAKEKSHPGCCDTKYTFFKVRDNHQSAGEVHAPLKPDIAAQLFYISYRSAVSLLNSSERVLHRSNAPPVVSNRPSYIINCVYRI